VILSTITTGLPTEREGRGGNGNGREKRSGEGGEGMEGHYSLDASCLMPVPELNIYFNSVAASLRHRTQYFYRLWYIVYNNKFSNNNYSNNNNRATYTLLSYQKYTVYCS